MNEFSKDDCLDSQSSRCSQSGNGEHDWKTDCTKCSQCGQTRRSSHIWRGSSCRNCTVSASPEIATQLLYTAVADRNLDVIKELIALGADINVKDRDGLSCLITAAIYNSTRVVELLLLHNIDVNACDNQGRTALHEAAKFGHSEVAQVLIHNGANIEAMETDTMVTPLMEAAINGQHRVVKLLLDAGANINIQDENGIAILHKAANVGSLEVVKILIEAGVNPYTSGEMNNLAQLIGYSINSENIELIHYLVTLIGADEISEVLEQIPCDSRIILKIPDLVQVLEGDWISLQQESDAYKLSDKLVLDAVRFSMSGNLKAAIVILKRAVKTCSNNANAWFILARYTIDRREAAICFKKFIHLRPHCKDGYVRLIKLYSDLEKDNLAYKIAKAYTEMLPKNADAWINRAVFIDPFADDEFQQEKIEEVRHCLGMALQIEPENRTAIGLLADLSKAESEEIDEE